MCEVCPLMKGLKGRVLYPTGLPRCKICHSNSLLTCHLSKLASLRPATESFAGRYDSDNLRWSVYLSAVVSFGL